MANLISLFRVLLGWALLILLSLNPSPWLYWVVFWGTVAVIWMDGLDGYVARKLNEASKLGAVIDILGDRVVEYLYWLYFFSFHWVPLWVPLLVIIRGVVVDGFRAIALEHGFTAFGSSSMMRSPVGILLVSSRFSRWSYAVFKAIAFSFMILVHHPDLPALLSGWGLPASVYVGLVAFTQFSVYATVFFCLVRGLPVIIESRRFFQSESL